MISIARKGKNFLLKLKGVDFKFNEPGHNNRFVD